MVSKICTLVADNISKVVNVTVGDAGFGLDMLIAHVMFIQVVFSSMRFFRENGVLDVDDWYCCSQSETLFINHKMTCPCVIATAGRKSVKRNLSKWTWLTHFTIVFSRDIDILNSNIYEYSVLQLFLSLEKPVSAIRVRHSFQTTFGIRAIFVVCFRC